jgi:hypothetical protein
MERVNITLEPEDLTLLKQLSARTGLSRSAVIREAIHRFARTSAARPPAKMDMDAWLREGRALAKENGPVDVVAEIRRWRDSR